MTAGSTTLAGRTAAAALMVDACTVSAPDTTGTLNESTGAYTPVAGAVHYTGACRVKVQPTQDHAIDAGERVILARLYIVSLPMSATTVLVDDVLRVTASALDAALAGTRMRVVDVPKGSHLTARRLICQELTS
jgi:hypothetical protein